MYNDRRTIIKSVVGICIIAAVLIIALATYFSITQADTRVVSIVVAPKDAEVTIDGRKVSGDRIRLTLGDHNYTVSRGDFRSQAGTITVIESEDLYISAALDPVNDAGRAYAATLDNQYSAVAAVGGGEATRRGEVFEAKNPIVAKLPYTNPLFMIGYRTDTSDPSGNSIIVTIHAPDIYRDNAVTQIRNWGYNPAEYNLQFINEENPFL